jgi:hypothetical protein
MKWNSDKIDQWYAGAILLCIAGFLLPSMRLIIGGETYNQWFIGTYGGQVVFLNFLVFAFLIQAIVYIKNKKTLPWVGLLTGGYVTLYAGNQLWKCLIRFKTLRPLTLVDKLQPECSPLAGVWLLLAAGIMLLTIAAIKIVTRSLSAKNLPEFQAEQREN